VFNRIADLANLIQELMTSKNKPNLDFNDLEFTVDFHCLLKILCIWWSWIWNLNNKDC